jgi:hypothetical protein
MNFKERMEQIFENINEGTWSTPNRDYQAMRLYKVVEWLKSTKEVNKQDLEDKIYHAFGDDELFDKIEMSGGSNRPNINAQNAIALIKQYVQGYLRDYDKWANDKYSSGPHGKERINPGARKYLDALLKL